MNLCHWGFKEVLISDTLYNSYFVFVARGLHRSKNVYPNPKRPINMLHRTDLKPYFIWKWDPNPCRSEKCLKCTTRTRPLCESWTWTWLRIHKADCNRWAHIAQQTAIILTTSGEKSPLLLLASLTVMHTILLFIHVWLFLSLADWKSFLNPLIMALKVHLLFSETDDYRNFLVFLVIFLSWVNFDCCIYPTITILFVGCNKDSEQ